MNSYSKVLISAVAALATQAEASGIHNSCLTLSNATIGEPDSTQQFMTNENTLTSGAVTSDMKLDGFVMCTDGDNVTGLQFFLTQTPYLETEYAELLLLDPIGQMTGDCGSLRFSGPVDHVKASTKRNNGVRGLAFHYEDKKAEVGGSLGGFRVSTQDWHFTEDQELIGVYGESSPNGIEKLGFITLDLQCQAAIDAEGP